MTVRHLPPQISFIALATLRVETPCRYISAIARLSALSIREPLSNPGMMGGKGSLRIPYLWDSSSFRYFSDAVLKNCRKNSFSFPFRLK